ncbi:MAG: glycosyltransferase [Thermodesulfobacteriota bacterium]
MSTLRNEIKKLKINIDYPPATRGLIVLWGLIASFPFPGMAWHRLHYLAGLRRLGFDVWYVEETDIPVMKFDNLWRTLDYEPNLRYLANLMDLIGFSNRWIFKPPGQSEKCFGARDKDGIYQLYRDADVVINHSGAQTIRPYHTNIKCLVYIETDPVTSQIDVASGDDSIIKKLDSHHYLFSYATNIGAPDCKIPRKKFTWLPTLPPVCVDWWFTEKKPRNFKPLTTIATWKHSIKDRNWEGQAWRWSKHHEFLKFINLPGKSRLPLELAIGGITSDEVQHLEENGWRIRSAKDLSSVDKYRDYIQNSLGEFTIAKEQYVASRSGWFSDRSTTYLASGRPVITQDTGFGNTIPTGEGLFAFSTEDQALAAIDAVATDYDRHASAALHIAKEYFEAERVFKNILTKIGMM